MSENNEKPDLKILWYLFAGFGIFLAIFVVIFWTTGKSPKPAPYVPQPTTQDAGEMPPERATAHVDFPDLSLKPSAAPVSVVPAEPLNVDPVTLLKAFGQHGDGDARFKGRRVVTSGSVVLGGEYPDVLFDGEGSWTYGVRCTFAGQKAEVTALKKHYTVAFEGTVIGRVDVAVILKDCVLKKVLDTSRYDPNERPPHRTHR